MNPFDLRGPEFLAFYAAFAAVAVVVAHLVRRARESGGSQPARISDPYSIALLRGGVADAACTAAVSLSRRGLLVEKDGALVAAEGAEAQVSDPLEAAVLRHGSAGLATSGFDAEFERAVRPRHADLERRGLLAGDDEREGRRRIALLLVLTLAGVAGTKIVVALSRGRTNVGFLVILAVVACVVGALVVLRPRRTPHGTRALRSLESLLGGLRTRARVSKAALDPAETALLAAVFGASAFAADALPHRKALLFPSRGAAGGSTSGCGAGSSTSSCGATASSCGSSSCGSSCGGGGGCGGCGS